MATIGSLFVSIGVKTADLDKGLSKAGKKLGTFSKVGLAGVGTGLAVVGTGMATVGLAAFDMSRDIEKSQNKIRAELGLTEAGAVEFGKMATDVFANNFGGSLDEVTEALIATRQQLGGLNKEEMTAATENAFRIADAFDEDVNKSLNSAAVLMEEFGLTQEQAFDFMTKGFQDGLNNSDDFLDSIGEYGNLFGDMGFSAAEFFSIMETGMEGGVLGTDKVADAMKEANILWNEADDDLQGVVDKMYGVEGAFVAIKRQGADLNDIFPELLEYINNIEDPILKAQTQTAVFGTMAEDLGVSFTEGLSAATTSLDDMAGATDGLNEQYNTLGAVGSELWRKTLVAITPATDALLVMANDAMPFLREMFEKAQPILAEFAATFSEKIKPTMTIVVDSLSRMGVALGISSGEASGMDIILGGLTTTLDLIITAMEAIAVVMYLVADAVEIASDAFAELSGRGDAVQGAFDNAAIIKGAAFSDPAALFGATGRELGIPGFATGGIVPGPMGAPQLAMVHGGETITPAGQSGGTNIYIDGIEVASGSNGGVDEALQMAFDILRGKLAASGA